MTLKVISYDTGEKCGVDCNDPYCPDPHVLSWAVYDDHVLIQDGFPTEEDAINWMEEHRDYEKDNSPSFYTVCVAEQSLGYGGPEEGGWWYTQTEPQIGKAFPTPVICKSLEKAFEAADEMQKWVDQEFPNQRELSSVLCTGRMEVYIFDEFPKFLPEVKPHYE